MSAEHYLEGPDRPERDEGAEMIVSRKEAVFTFVFLADVIGQQGALVLVEIVMLRRKFLDWLVGNMTARADLAVRVRIGSAHHFAFVLEDLHVIDEVAAAK